MLIWQNLHLSECTFGRNYIFPKTYLPECIPARMYIWPKLRFPENQGMVWNGMEDDFSIFHTGNFLPFHFYSIVKIFHSIFHSILKFSSIFHSIPKSPSIFHSILPYQRNFRLEAMQRIFCCFAPLQCCKQLLVKARHQYQHATTSIWYAYYTWFNG